MSEEFLTMDGAIQPQDQVFVCEECGRVYGDPLEVDRCPCSQWEPTEWLPF